MLHCLTLTTSCCGAWCPLHQVVLFDLACMVLGCLIFSASCCRLIPPASCYAAWYSLNHVMLLDLVFTMPRGLIVSTSCYAAEPSLPYVSYVSWCSLPHGMLFDLVIKTVRCLIFATSCYVLDLPVLCSLCSLYIVELFVWSAATLLDLLYLLLGFLGCPTSCDAA